MYFEGLTVKGFYLFLYSIVLKTLLFSLLTQLLLIYLSECLVTLTMLTSICINIVQYNYLIITNLGSIAQDHKHLCISLTRV